jgi:hypothetical protein
MFESAVDESGFQLLSVLDFRQGWEDPWRYG